MQEAEDETIFSFVNIWCGRNSVPMRPPKSIMHRLAKESQGAFDKEGQRQAEGRPEAIRPVEWKQSRRPAVAVEYRSPCQHFLDKPAPLINEDLLSNRQTQVSR